MKLLSKLYSVYVALALVCVVCVAPFIDFYCRQPWNDLVPTIVAFIGALVLGGIFVAFWRAREGSEVQKDTFVRNLVLLCLGLFLLQLVIVYGCIFACGWDVGHLRRFGMDPSSETGYLNRNQNQLFLAGVFYAAFSVASFFGFTKAGYLLLVLASCLSVTIAIFLASYTTHRVYGPKVAYPLFGVSALLIGVSPWILVPYSDTYTMPFVAAVICAYTCVKRPPIKWFLVVFCALIGYALKPTIIFALIAIGGMALSDAIAHMKDRPKGAHARQSWDYILPVMLKCVCGIVLAVVLQFAVVKAVESPVPELDPEASKGPAHFLMMGFNRETGGGWSSADTKFSSSYPTQKERTQANIEEWKRRVREAGPAGVTVFLFKKTLSNYADGTFCWEREGRFYKVIEGRIPALMWFYGISEDEIGGNESVGNSRFAIFEQILWLFILMGIVLNLFSKDLSRTACIVSVALLMLSGFLLLFEPRSRYLILYAPWFVFLGLSGWYTVVARKNRRLELDAERNELV